MNTKTLLTFVLGAVLAAAAVYIAVGRRPAPEPVIQSTAPVTAVPDVSAPEQPAEAPVAVDPLPSAEPPARAEQPRRSAVVRQPDRRVEEKRPSPVATRQEPAPQPAPAPAQQTAQNTTPAAPPPPPEYQSETPSPAAAAQNLEERKPAPRVPQTATIPAGTLLTVRLDQALSSERNDAGDAFRATLDAPLVVDNNVIAERGARVEGRVVEVDRGGRVRGVAQMTLELVSVNTSDGQRVRVQTETFARQAEQDRKRDIAKVGAAAGIGAAIGAIAGGGKGAAIGAAVGGAAGTGGVMATRGKAAEIPAETRVSFRLAQPVTVTEKLP